MGWLRGGDGAVEVEGFFCGFFPGVFFGLVEAALAELGVVYVLAEGGG